jgi:hypothetical protein
MMIVTFIPLRTLKFKQPLQFDVDLAKAFIPKDTIA